MQLLAIYAVLVALGEAAAIGIGEIVELSYPSASLFTFLGLFFLTLWGAWRLAVRITGG